MTTAPARAVSRVFSRSNLRATLMAAASVGLLAALAPGASAAPCITDDNNNTCVITLGNIGDSHDGKLGTDKLEFNDAGNTISATGANFAATGSKFVNFETAEIVAGTTLNLTSASGDAAPASLAWTVNGILNVSGAGKNSIGDASTVTVGAAGVFNVNADELIGSLAGSGSVVLGGASILSAGGSGAATPFSGIISGTGGFTKTGSSLLRLTGDNSYTGATVVNGGVLEIGNAGAIDNSSGVTISAGTLSSKGIASYTINGPVTITTTNELSRLTGNAVINGNFTSNGGIQPGNTSVPTWPTGTTVENPGQDMGQVTINGNYQATGGFAYVGMFIDIDASLPAGGVAGTDKDFLTINGNMLGTQATKFSVASFDEVPIGGATTGNGIQVIRITGTSANEGRDFFQGNALTAGVYQYLLRYVQNYSGTDDGYFLQSAARDELTAHPALLSASQQMVRGCFRDEQRIPDSPKGATYGRAWFGYHQGATEYGPDTGIDMDLDYSCTTGGMDWRMGYGWFGGVAGGFGSANGDLSATAGLGDLDGDARVIEAYAAFTSSSFFVNLSAGYTDMDWTWTGALTSAQQTSVSGFIASAQAGVALDLEFIAVKLIGAVNYDGSDCGESCFGFTVSEETGLIEAKGTVRFDGVTWGGSIRPWAAVSFSDVLSDGVNTVSAGPFTTSAATNEQLLSIDGGLQTYLDENFAVFVDGSYQEGLSNDITGYKGGIGLKLYW
jgi:autotransporter-associated beta strand protein